MQEVITLKPFRDYEIQNIIDSRKNKIKDYIQSLSDEVAMSGQDDVIIHNMVEQYKLELVEIQEEIKENRKIEKQQ